MILLTNNQPQNEEENEQHFSNEDFVLPGFNLTEECVKEILFMVDISGSMSIEDVQDCFSEIQSALIQFNGRIKGKIGFFDVIVHEVYDIDGDTDLKTIYPHGRGGTDFNAVFNYALSLDNPPSSIIILTDGRCNFPKESAANNVPVLWIINNEQITPPWGKVIRLIR